MKRTWLETNVELARKKLLDCWPVREEIIRLKQIMTDTLGVVDVIWDCGWGSAHCRGCLQSFLSLASHHPEIMEILRGKNRINCRMFGAS